MKKRLFLSLILLCLFFVPFSSAQAAENQHRTVIYFFWGDGCPHCAEEEKFLPNLERQYPTLEVKSYETWYSRDNAELFQSLAQAYDFEARGVPATFIGDFDPIPGFGTAETTGALIEERVAYCVENGCIDPGSKIGLAPVDPDIQSNPTPQEEVSRIASLPLIGEVDASKTGILVFTVLVGLLDGFNACAMWVLCFLLTLLVYSQSRKRIFLIGGTFILISGLMYLLFIAGWMSIFLFAGSVRFIQVAIGLLALVFGLVSIKDFFWFGKGVSFIIPEKSKKKILKKMRQVVKPSASLSAAVLGVALLAIGVNAVELLCSLGLPAVYTSILNSYGYPALINFLFLLVYVLFYMIDDFIIFVVVVMTMSSKKFTEKYGRVSKLISGVVILALGLIMLIKPELMMF